VQSQPWDRTPESAAAKKVFEYCRTLFVYQAAKAKNTRGKEAWGMPVARDFFLLLFVFV
jgi:hypothetical protein